MRLGSELRLGCGSPAAHRSIRGLVYDVNHDRVNDLRGEFAADMLSVLQTKVERAGLRP